MQSLPDVGAPRRGSIGSEDSREAARADAENGWRHPLYGAILVLLMGAGMASAETFQSTRPAFLCRAADGAVTLVDLDGAGQGAPKAECRPVTLPVALQNVRWATTLSRSEAVARDRIVVSGAGAGLGFSPAEARYEPAPGPPARLPPLTPGVALIPMLAGRIFGAEERATFVRTDDAITLTCRAGAKPAGLILDSGNRRMPDGTDILARWQSSGDIGFTVAIVARGASAEHGSLLATGPTTMEVPFDGASRGAPVFVMSCPDTSGQITVSDIRLIGRAASRAISRAAWAWKPVRWRDAAEALIDEVCARRVDRLFVSVQIVGDALADEMPFSAFVTSAHRKGIAVVVVEGDPGMALAVGRNAALRRLAALAAYQRRAAPAARLDGLQYDIEPYLLPAFADEPERVFRGWAETLDALFATRPPFGLDMVLPFWLPHSPAAHLVLPAIARTAERVTAMAYRTTATEVVAAAEPMLAWGAATGLPVHVALEAGPLGDETIRIYGRAPAGDLWTVPQPDGGSLLLLLNEPRTSLGDARVYALERESVNASSRVSFLGDHERLDATASELADALAAWPSFKGFALHGVID